MGRVIRSPEARDDLVEIWLYIAIAQDNQATADQVLENINQKFLLLSDSPLIGRERQEISSGLRSFPASSYVIFYRPINGGIDVVRVLHGARNVEDLL
jgi:toxin ParE1/3/4